MYQDTMSSRLVPRSSPMAAFSADNPSSDSSILRVILGFVLFSSSYPGVYMVGGKKIWTPIPYSPNSERNVSARPIRSRQHNNIPELCTVLLTSESPFGRRIG